jgi:hypothetical protein
MVRTLLIRLVLVFIASIMTSCGGGTSSPPTLPLVDGSHSISPGIASDVLGPLTPPGQKIAAAQLIDTTNLMDWAEQEYPQYFPSHQQPQFSAPYVYRYYPETGSYLGVDGQYVRVLGPMFGPDILTVGVLSDFVCRVFPENCAPPTANAGTPKEVLVGSVVTLTGSGVDPNGAQLSYVWTLASKPAGSAAALTGATSTQPSFIADLPGNYLAALVVSNGTSTSATSTIVVTAKSANVAPVANAGGSRSVAAASTVFLNGSLSSDANGDPLTYSWTLTRPAGSYATLVDASTASPYFTADIGGLYVVTLVVNDGQVNSAPATVSVTATSTSAYCCKHCMTGKPCGDTCISVTYTCHTLGGCACY